MRFFNENLRFAEDPQMIAVFSGENEVFVDPTRHHFLGDPRKSEASPGKNVACNESTKDLIVC